MGYEEKFLGQQRARACRAVPACGLGWLWPCQRVQKDGLEQRQPCSVFSSGELGQGRNISNGEMQGSSLPSRACFGAVWSDSKGRAWGEQHLSGSLARRCFEGGVSFPVSQSSPQPPRGPLFPAPLAVALRALVSFPAAVGKAPGWLGGELWERLAPR